MLPKLSGLDVCRAIRAESQVPILMLTAKDSEADKVTGLELGADDYVTKPFSPREVVARVKAVLRRSSRAPHGANADLGPLEFGELRIDPAAREVTGAGKRIRLTPKEFDLLLLLASHPGHVFSRIQLLDELWDFAFDGDPSTVTVHVRRVREKIERDPSAPRHLVTVWGAGYRFDP